MHSRDLASLAGEETIFGGFAAEKLKRLQAELEPLSRRYDVVVANPPYMGSKNMNKWLGDWIKTHCKDVKGDLFSCFMMRNVGMGAERCSTWLHDSVRMDVHWDVRETTQVCD